MRATLATLVVAGLAWIGATPGHAQPSDVDPRRSLVATERPILERFPLQRVLDQLVAQSGVRDLTLHRLGAHVGGPHHAAVLLPEELVTLLGEGGQIRGVLEPLARGHRQVARLARLDLGDDLVGFSTAAST